ncbi:hypothetical protein D3C73_1186540 [compost metagenome]
MSPLISSVAGSTNSARLSESPMPGCVNITRVVSPGAGAGRTANRRGPGPMRSCAARTWLASGCAGPVDVVCSWSAYSRFSICGVSTNSVPVTAATKMKGPTNSPM